METQGLKISKNYTIYGFKVSSKLKDNVIEVSCKMKDGSIKNSSSELKNTSSRSEIEPLYEVYNAASNFVEKDLLPKDFWSNLKKYKGVKFN
jgi:hypothetical protein